MQRLRTRRVRALLIVVVVALMSASAALALSLRVEPVKSLAVYDAKGSSLEKCSTRSNQIRLS